MAEVIAGIVAVFAGDIAGSIAVFVGGRSSVTATMRIIDELIAHFVVFVAGVAVNGNCDTAAPGIIDERIAVLVAGVRDVWRR